MPRLLNIWRAKSGKPAAVIDRRKVLPAIAEAALVLSAGHNEMRDWYLQHEIGVDNVVEQLNEDGQKAEASEQSRKRRRDPVDGLLVARPSEPEQTNREEHTTEDDRRQTPFWDGNAAIGGKLLDVPLVVDNDVARDEEDANDHAEEW